MQQIIIQKATKKEFVPKSILLKHFAVTALNIVEKNLTATGSNAKKMNLQSIEMTIRIVESDEMKHLNGKFRQQFKATNVLSFPANFMTHPSRLRQMLGDIAICAEVVNEEAKTQQKDNHAHWAHMVVHGVCHLLGYDHEKKMDAEIMERLEIKIMQTLGFKDPYHSGENIS